MESTTAQIETLLANAGGDATRLRRTLVRRSKDGDMKATSHLTMLDAYEAEQDAILDAIASDIEKRDADIRAKKKLWYAMRYPKVNI